MAKQTIKSAVGAGVHVSRDGVVTITKRRYSQYQIAEQQRDSMRIELQGYRDREAGIMAAMDEPYASEFAEQNRLLLESGEEPLTAAEFLSCRLADAQEVVARVQDLIAKLPNSGLLEVREVRMCVVPEGIAAVDG